MTVGIYGYWDRINQYVVYVGKDSNIHNNSRHKQHIRTSERSRQVINKALQKQPDRYVYFKIIEGEYSDYDLNQLEQEFIKLLKTNKKHHKDKRVFNFTNGGDGFGSGVNNPNYKDYYTISKSAKQGYQILGKNNKAIKRCVDKNKLLPLIQGLNNGTLSEDDVKNTNLRYINYTISKGGHGTYQIRGKNKNIIKRCIDKNKLIPILDDLNSGAITEDEASRIKIRLDFIYRVSKAGTVKNSNKPLFRILDEHGRTIKYSPEKEKLEFICDALNSKIISAGKVNKIYGVDNVLIALGR